MRLLPRLWLLAPLLAAAACSDGNEPGQTGSVEGTVTNLDTHQPLAGVTIAVDGRSGLSSSDGRYALSDVPAGARQLTASLAGYQSFTGQVSIAPGESTRLDIALKAGAAIDYFSAVGGPTVGTVFLTWTTIEGRTYNLYWSTSPGVTVANGTKIAGVSSPYVHAGLTPGASYYYVLTSAGPEGESAPSPEIHATARGDITIEIISPRALTTVDTGLVVVAEIASTFSLTSVTAKVGALSAPMTFGDPAAGAWRGTLSLASLPSPAAVAVEVAVVAANGEQAAATVGVLFDRAPALVLTSPLNGAVLREGGILQGTCTDDSPTGCTSVTVTDELHRVLFSSSGDPNGPFSIEPVEGRVRLEIVALDAVGRRTVTSRYVFLTQNPLLVDVASAGSGVVVDADASRLLAVNFVDEIAFGPGVGGDTVRLVDRLTGSSTTVFVAESTVVASALLTPVGALVLTQRPRNVSPQLRELRNGTLSTIAAAPDIPSVQVAGDWAIWLAGDFGPLPTLFRRNLVTAMTQQVATGVEAADVLPSGEVLFVAGGEVFRFAGGTPVQLTDNAGVPQVAIAVEGDGTHVVMTVQPTPCCPPTAQSLVLLDPGADVVLATVDATPPFLTARLNGGWIAFTRPDAVKAPQVWVRSPAGVETQLSFFANGAELVTLDGTGEAVFRANNRLYRASPTRPAEEIGSFWSTPLYLDGVLHVLLGASVFRVS